MVYLHPGHCKRHWWFHCSTIHKERAHVRKDTKYIKTGAYHFQLKRKNELIKKWIIDLTVLYLVNIFFVNFCRCGYYQKSFGSIALFLAWFNFVLFIRKVPVFGIYIVMFLYVFKTFFKFFVVFIFFIATFAFAFFVLLRDGQVWELII